MSKSIVMEELIRAITQLEENGDIVVVNPIENEGANKLHDVVCKVSSNLLTVLALGGIVNELNGHKLGFGLDNSGFQTIIGLTKEELEVAESKLKVPSV